MAQGYELWDGETGNRVGFYQTRDAALRAAAETVRSEGADSDAVCTLGLLGPEGLIAQGPALVMLASRSLDRQVA